MADIGIYTSLDLVNRSEVPEFASMFADTTSITRQALFVPMGANRDYRWSLEHTLPTASAVAYGEKTTASTNGKSSYIVAPKKIESAVEVVREAGLDDARGLTAVMFEAGGAAAKAIANQITTQFFTGSVASEPRQFDGLNSLCVNTSGYTNLHYADGAGSAGAVITDDKLKDLIDSIYGKPQALYMSKAMKRELDKLKLANSQINYAPEGFGRQVAMYDDIPIYTIDKIGTTEVLGFNETVGGSTTCGSIYAIKWDQSEGLFFTLKEELTAGQIVTPEYNTTKSVYRQDFWMRLALVLKRPDGAARLSGILAS